MFFCKQISQIVLITFSGMDGAGKSTQISLLCNYLSSKGKKSSVFWSRGGYTFGFELLKKMFRFFFNKKLPPKGKNSKRTKIISNPLIARTWLNLAILDLIALYSFIRIKSFLGYYIICDRYVEDTRLDFIINFPSITFQNYLSWKLLEFIKSKPDFSFLLMVSPALSVSRGLEKDEPYPDDLVTLKKRYNLYSDPSIFSPKQYKILDCSVKKEKVSKSILTSVFSKSKSQ